MGHSTNAKNEAKRRWGRVRVVQGGLARSGRKRIPRRRLPGTVAERRIVERLVGRALPPEEMADAIKILRTGARLKELEINQRLERILTPAEE